MRRDQLEDEPGSSGFRFQSTLPDQRHFLHLDERCRLFPKKIETACHGYFRLAYPIPCFPKIFNPIREIPCLFPFPLIREISLDKLDAWV